MQAIPYALACGTVMPHLSFFSDSQRQKVEESPRQEFERLPVTTQIGTGSPNPRGGNPSLGLGLEPRLGLVPFFLNPHVCANLDHDSPPDQVPIGTL